MDLITFVQLPRSDRFRLKNSAKIAQKLEDEWSARILRNLDLKTKDVVEALADRKATPELDIERMMTEHYFDVAIKAMQLAESEKELNKKIPRLAKPKIPDSLAKIRKMYDLWKKGKYKPRYAAKKAAEIRDLYLKTVRSVWEKHSRDFRNGDVATQEEVIKQIRKEAQVPLGRAKTIVRTETTNYYNAARKEYYDQSEDITHYLLIAIRDAITSPWCTPLTIKGKRGRSGLVYAKDDPLADKERPAVHPGCRSEFLPLNRYNPAHLKFINDPAIQRRNVTCFPLLRDWRSA